MEAKVFASKEFRSFANTDLVLTKFNLKRGGSSNSEGQRLASEHGVTSIPRLVLLSPEGDVIKKTGGFSSSSGLIRSIGAAAR